MEEATIKKHCIQASLARPLQEQCSTQPYLAAGCAVLRVLRMSVQELSAPQLAQAVAEGVHGRVLRRVLWPPTRLGGQPSPPRHHPPATQTAL
jgi:hypothetical protein